MFHHSHQTSIECSHIIFVLIPSSAAWVSHPVIRFHYINITFELIFNQPVDEALCSDILCQDVKWVLGVKPGPKWQKLGSECDSKEQMSWSEPERNPSSEKSVHMPFLIYHLTFPCIYWASTVCELDTRTISCSGSPGFDDTYPINRALNDYLCE